VHIDDESLVTDELVNYIHRAHTWATRVHRGAPTISQSAARLYTKSDRDSGARPPDPRALRPDGGLEVSIAILNHIADSRLVLLNNCGHWPPFEKPAEWTAQVLAFLQRY